MRKLNFIIFSALFISILVSCGINGKVNKPEQTVGTANFNTDPSNNGFGFVSINSGNEPNMANSKDVLNIPDLKEGTDFTFTVFMDFHNNGQATIYNAKGSLDIVNPNDNGKLIIKGKLFGQNINEITDETYLTNYRNNYKIELMGGYIENTHGTTDPEFCGGYNMKSDILKSQPIQQPIIIGDLDSYKKGWCDQGYIVYNFRISN